MFGRRSIVSRRPCPQCGGHVHYIATFLTLFTGFRKRKCRDCGYVEASRVKIIVDPAH